MVKLEINEMARLLQLPLDTLHRWVRQGRIPFERKGDAIRFDRDVIEKWADTHKVRFHRPKGDPDPPAPAADHAAAGLAAALARGCVIDGISGADPASLIQNAVDAIAASGGETLPAPNGHLSARLKELLLEREALTSTGIGNGIAIPHPRAPMETFFPTTRVATVFPSRPVDFNAVDRKPVFVFFFLLSPTSRQHLQLLSSLSFCVRDASFVDFLRRRPDKENLMARIREAETRMKNTCGMGTA